MCVAPGCPADPFENETKYPGVRVGARGKTVPVGSLYGYASGIVGLRLFPNPDFDEAAKAKWDAGAYFKGDLSLVRPYRVGMSCGFCHVGPSPMHPPADPANPQWADLSSTVGAQYMWVDRLFVYRANPDNYFFQLVHTYRPGAMDTSLVSTDNINNPRTMNAVYSLGPRLEQALRWGRETLAGGQLNNKQFNDYLSSGPLTRFFQKPNTVWTPRVLKDGSDSVGALGALNRVYLNIGLFSEEWLLHFNPVVGGKPISPIAIATAEKNSSYWQATEAWTPHTAWFFLQAAKPDRLKDAPGGAKYLTTDARGAGSRQDGVRRDLRALPFEQGAEAGGRAWIRRAAPGPATCSAGTSTGRGRRPTTTSGRCARSSARRISSTTTTCRPRRACR